MRTTCVSIIDLHCILLARGFLPQLHLVTLSKSLYLPGTNGVQLAATSFGASEQTVLLLHGAGQTRHSWRHAGGLLAQSGWNAISIDTRGHGESDWPENGDYSIDTLMGDLKSVVEHLHSSGKRKPILVGASLGGMTSLLVEGESEEQIFEALILVDITPKIEQSGVVRIIEFMNRHQNGFNSVDEAAAAVARYQSHRRDVSKKSDGKRAQAVSGLKKNLRQGEDGRYYWHWDPRLMQHVSGLGETLYQRQLNAASKLTLPVLLIRGQQSEIVSSESARELLELVPHAKYTDIADAAHMVAGDNNDVFVRSVLEFIGEA